jgi:hypothetical protein
VESSARENKVRLRNIFQERGNIFALLNLSAFFLKKYLPQFRNGVTNEGRYFEVYPEHRFPHVLFYSTLLAVLSIAAVGLNSSHVLR